MSELGEGSANKPESLGSYGVKELAADLGAVQPDGAPSEPTVAEVLDWLRKNPSARSRGILIHLEHIVEALCEARSPDGGQR